MIEKLKQFIVKHLKLKHYCHCHHDKYCTCKKSLNDSYELSLNELRKRIIRSRIH